MQLTTAHFNNRHVVVPNLCMIKIAPDDTQVLLQINVPGSEPDDVNRVVFLSSYQTADYILRGVFDLEKLSYSKFEIANM